MRRRWRGRFGSGWSLVCRVGWEEEREEEIRDVSKKHLSVSLSLSLALSLSVCVWESNDDAAFSAYVCDSQRAQQSSTKAASCRLGGQRGMGFDGRRWVVMWL